ncbi:DUF2515 family protein [Paraburkholderia sp. J67]|uniref:DUF2515 family protein n=1 Tax=Paraburkholderia sp. J67 TaxID=2805435 RepID=UPI002ABDEC71|nr:hypothetical protein [Paraburkholderia sp. J67]
MASGAKKSQLGYLQHTDIIADGFKSVGDWETGTAKERPGYALAHLLSIAQHEQGEVLQGLIYDDERFQWWLKLQRGALASSDDTAINDSTNAMHAGQSDGSEVALAPLVRALVPSLQLVLTSDDETDNADFRSDAPDRLVLWDYQKRMDWIQKAADKFHDLMQGEKSGFMMDYLHEIKSWGDKPDR